jgi:hypothetical protein
VLIEYSLEKYNVGDDSGLRSLCRPCSNPVESYDCQLLQWPSGFLSTHTQAPMKLLYEVAFALQILLPKHTKVDAISTGRLPKQV